MKKLTDIVIIDDDEISCFISRMLLEDLQLEQPLHYITEPTKALDFLKDLCAKSSGCILAVLDAHMPIMDGFEILEELNQWPATDRARIHVVLVTSILTDREILKASKFKVEGTYSKPLNKELLLEAMAKIPVPCA